MGRFIAAIFFSIASVASPARALEAPSVNPLAAVSLSWAQEWQNKKLEAVLALYTDDAVFMDATGSRMTGKPALRKFFAIVLAQYSAHPTLHSVKCDADGGLGYDWGDYSETVIPVATPDKAIQTKGTYLVILRRVHGQWLIADQMWTGNVPVPVKR
jgi:uncharacterized protein (TIGR02246 family)